ncbi:hypothetical protein SO802_012611 [Lithocarpus litseifolius]|uniref:Ycf1 n=1 Tax=Lithocarpus litseifolius TaxID=425828 RepID=A0AAW2D797_9ROSI
MELKFTSKSLQRQAKKCEEEEKSKKLKIKKAMKKGNIDGARIYAENAIQKRTEQMNYLLLASCLDPVVARLDTQAKMSRNNHCHWNNQNQDPLQLKQPKIYARGSGTLVYKTRYSNKCSKLEIPKNREAEKSKKNKDRRRKCEEEEAKAGGETAIDKMEVAGDMEVTSDVVVSGCNDKN